jgi:pimeloyl-ACP methyl ester carboxylesterase
MPKGPEPPMRNFTKAQQVLYRITSAICTTLFLTCLFICAIFHLVFQKLKSIFDGDERRPVTRDTQEQKTDAELRLLPDLNYYFRIYGLRVDTYEIITDDGFVLTVQRIVDPKETLEDRQKRKPILCLHGLLQSSGSFCSSGKQSLAYFFHDEGYDVWLGNNRCGFEPKHTFLSPNDYRMWDWDIVDMAQHDLPAMINHVLSTTDSSAKSLSLIGHSQGATQGFITLDSDKFGLSTKIKCFVALSPAVFGGELLDTKLFIRLIAQMSTKSFFFGINSFLPIMMNMRKLLVKTRLFGTLSYMMFNYLFDWNDSLWDQDIEARHFLFSPVYVSVKLMSWWLNNKSGFKQSKSILARDRQWFSEYTPPIFLVVPRKDLLVDGQALLHHMEHYEKDAVKYSYIHMDSYSHLDVLWSRSVIQDVGIPVLAFLKALEANDRNG